MVSLPPSFLTMAAGDGVAVLEHHLVGEAGQRTRRRPRMSARNLGTTTVDTSVYDNTFTEEGILLV